jgi:hypothetical protein
MAEIDVARSGGDDAAMRFRVVVREGDSSTEHDVTLSHADLDRLGSSYGSPESFVRACFAFLLEREPKESILPTFDVSVIGGYFPGFERTIAREG